MRTTFAHIIVGIIDQSDSTENRSYAVQSHSKVYSTCLYRLEDAIAKGNMKGMQPYNMIKHIPCSTIILFLQKIVREEIMQFPPPQTLSNNLCDFTPRAHAQQRVKQSRCLSVCRSVRGQRNIETAEIRGYSLRKGYYNNVCAILGRS